jgi:hypothetical protein
MESQDLQTKISVLQANILELGELAVALTEDPVARAKTLMRLNEQTIRLNFLHNFDLN